MFSSPYVPQSLCPPVLMFRSPQVPFTLYSPIPFSPTKYALCFPVSMFPSLFAPQSLCSPTPFIPDPDIPQKWFPVPLFPKYISQSLSSLVPIFLRPFLSPGLQSWSSPELFPAPMFPKDVLQSLCFSPVLIFPRFVSSHHVAQRCFPVPLFPRSVLESTCSTNVFSQSEFTVPISTWSVSQYIRLVFPRPYVSQSL